jgi:signal transduction histidine kinase
MPNPAIQHNHAGQMNREAIHDLRNLFSIVASAKHMLDDGPVPDRRSLLLSAIEDAAISGSRLTTDLLTSHGASDAFETLDLNARIAAVEPMIRALAGGDIEINFDLCPHRLPIRLDQLALDGAILELITNARAALKKPGRIIVRTRRIGRRAWLTIADNGCGTDVLALERGLATHQPSANGTGLRRVRSFLRKAHGHFRIRSREGSGTIVSMNLPMVLCLAVDEPAVSPPAAVLPPKESEDEKRQSATA